MKIEKWGAGEILGLHRIPRVEIQARNSNGADDLVVDAEVVVNEPVAHAGPRRPHLATRRWV
ncbi:MAG: hypothetical protein ACREL7_14110, partial [Longimicrobiales bacterium]